MNKNYFKVASIYIGTVIGAGFASGREIIDFFGIYGKKGIYGMIISGMLFSILGSLLLLKIYNKEIKGFKQLICNIFGNKFGLILDLIITISLYTGFSVMISGSGAIFKEELGFSYNYGIFVMVVLSFIVFLYNVEGLSFINSLLVPLLIVGILIISTYIIRANFNGFTHINGVKLTLKGNFLTSAILYVGSNSLIIIIVFSALYPLLDSKKTAIYGGILGGSILFILGISILLSMLIFKNELLNLDIPMIFLSNKISLYHRKFYGIILWIAMFTTAIANGFGFINKISNHKYKTLFILLYCLLAIPLAKIGFSKLIGIIYPVFGVVGFIILILILIS